MGVSSVTQTQQREKCLKRQFGGGRQKIGREIAEVKVFKVLGFGG